MNRDTDRILEWDLMIFHFNIRWIYPVKLGGFFWLLNKNQKWLLTKFQSPQMKPCVSIRACDDLFSQLKMKLLSDGQL